MRPSKLATKSEERSIERLLYFIGRGVTFFSWEAFKGFKAKDIWVWVWGTLATWGLALGLAVLDVIPLPAGLSLLLLLALFVTGILLSRKKLMLQRGLDLAGLANVKGERPRVLKIVSLDDYRTEVYVRAIGVGIDEFLAKKGRLESAFMQSIESVNYSKDRKLVKIKICKRQLPNKITYSKLGKVVKGPCSFVIGESLSGGMLFSDIRSLPHLLIGGTTGGGKSNFFKTTLLELLKSTPHLQMYLIDLKRGVEVKEFTALPNVRVAKNEMEAVAVLAQLKREMDRRYEYLEKNGYKNIEPERDQMDLIVVGTDEASVLFGQVKSNKAKKDLMLKARELTDDLAKLARASGIHLVIATQKPIKESIDTKTLENLPARMSFKMSTHAGSNSMLGNAKAYALPDIKGRGIWKDGNKFIEVQTPFLSDEELEQEILEIKTQGIKNFQSMLKDDGGDKKAANALEQGTKKESDHREEG